MMLKLYNFAYFNLSLFTKSEKYYVNSIDNYHFGYYFRIALSKLVNERGETVAKITLCGLAPRRRSANMTQAEFADKLGVQRGRVAMWETGASLPMADLLPAIAEILECTIDDLFHAA